MMRSARLRRAALLGLLSLAAVPAWSQGTNKATLGLCPSSTGPLDGYVQALCEGERALEIGDLGAALHHFRLAAELPRIDATNELAWAGLAAAHCRSREVDAGRRWAEHFGQARQLWLGELDCAAGNDDPRGRLSPFVRGRMCSEKLAADYTIVRNNPQAAPALDLRRRLQQASDAIATACTSSSDAQPLPKSGSEAASASAAGKQAVKKSGRRTGEGPARRRAGKAPKPG